MIRVGPRFGRAVCSGIALTLSACGNGPAPATAVPPAQQAGIGRPAAEPTRAIAAVDSVVHESLAAGVVPGMAVAVAQGAHPPVLRAYGYADLTQQIPMSTETVLPFGSILKQFTAAAVLRLVDDGRLRLEDSVLEFFPEFPGDWQPVTIHHLLNHTSGIPRSLAPGWTERARETRAELLQEMAERGPLEFPPGERWAYNNGAYVILALLIEQRSGEAYDHHLRRTLLEPLGMNSTRNSDSIPPELPRAMGYDTAQGRLVERPATGNRAAMGSGFYHATAGDLLAWQQALRSGRVLRPETYAKMTSPTILDGGEVWPYGYGVWLRELDGRRRVGHGGVQAGFRPYVGYLPDEDLSVVLLINSGAVDSWAVGESILRAVLAASAADTAVP